MTDFTNGPAKGKILELTRVPMPLFLRVTQGIEGDIDALDKLEDTPTADEILFAYKKIADKGTVHIDGRDKQGKRFGRWYNPCTYALVEQQPDQATMRDKTKWQAWCTEQVAKSKEEKTT